MLHGTVRRAVVFVAVFGGSTAVISVTLGALAGKSLLRSLAVGFYVAGAAALVLSFVFGSRGPLRRESPEGELEAGPPRRRGFRKTTPEERSEARRSSLGLFAFGIALVLLGAAVDPSRHAL